ncbi:MAG: hypothetical protein JNK67_29765 [Alphaproteobacteria bacterium]|nr:hypothetical protein [Alphaproteobacteria bacterium]
MRFKGFPDRSAGSGATRFGSWFAGSDPSDELSQSRRAIDPMLLLISLSDANLRG